MAKKTFNILETFFSNKNPSKEIQVQALDKAYIVCHKDYNLFLKCRYNFNNIVGAQSRKYIACYYLQNAVPVFISVCGSVSFQGSCERYKNAWLDGVRVLPLGMAIAPPPTFSPPLLPIPRAFLTILAGPRDAGKPEGGNGQATGKHWASKPFSGQATVF